MTTEEKNDSMANDENQENLPPIEYPIPLNVVSKIIDCNFQGSYEEDLVKALAKTTVQFITTIATIANRNANNQRRKTIHAQDVLSAVVELGFREMGCELIEFHASHMEEKESQPKAKRRKSQKSDSTGDEDGGDNKALDMSKIEEMQKTLEQLKELQRQLQQQQLKQQQQPQSSSQESESAQDDDDEEEEDDDDDVDDEDDEDNENEENEEDADDNNNDGEDDEEEEDDDDDEEDDENDSD